MDSRGVPLSQLPPIASEEIQDSSDADDSSAPLSPPNRESREDMDRNTWTKRTLKQFGLLTWKNIIVLKRSIIWTLFEMVAPLLFFLIIYIIAKNSDVKHESSYNFSDLKLYGNGSDFDSDGCPFQCINFGTKNYRLLYSVDSRINRSEADKIFSEMENRMKYKQVSMSTEYVNDRREMERVLQKDYNTDYIICNQKYLGGVYVKELNRAHGTFSYQLLFPYNSGFKFSSDYTGGSPFVYTYPTRQKGQPESIKVYCQMGILSIQLALNSEFAKLNGSHIDSTLNTRPFPIPQHNVYDIESLLSLSYVLFSFITLSIVLHTTREIASEKESGMKDFLMVMGMSRGVFYTSHITMAFAKAAIAMIINCIPFFISLTVVSPFLVLISVLLYSLCVIIIASLIAAIFNTAANAIKVSFLIPFLLSILCYASPSRDNVPLAFIASLNPNTALSYAFGAFSEALQRDEPLGLTTMFHESQYVFTIGCAIIMLIVDVFILFILTLMIDWLFTSSDSPFTILDRFFRRKSPLNRTSTTLPNSLSGAEETDSSLTIADIEVNGVVKMYGNQAAVDQLTMTAYKGQVTVLLGHNGAGKSTTFNMICGLTSPSSGSIRICGMDIRDSLAECQDKIGYCPQGNPLFNLLTVDEHLQFFASLKGVNKDYWKNDRERLLDTLKLKDKRGTRSMNLSGGMKRKLCVGMALIGRSPVILLDEPTAGMDPGARRDIETLLESYKKQSTILMTTHYTDEAEQLGERMVIMAKGRAVCSGTSAFLKKRFHMGYVMSVVMESPNEDNSRILERVKKYVKRAEGQKVHASQMEICLPKEDHESFPRLFADLEESSRELGITSFGLSLNSLEQVFLTVGELADPSDDIDGSDTIKQVIDNHDEIDSCISRTILSMKALLWKRFLYTKANYGTFFSQFIVPLLLILLISNILTLVNVSLGEDKMLTMNSLPHSRFILFDYNVPIPQRIDYMNRIRNTKRIQGVEVSGIDNVDNWYLSDKPHRPPISTGVSMKDDNITSLHHNGAFLRSFPSLLTLIDGVRYGVDISTSIHLYSQIVEDTHTNSTDGGPAFDAVKSVLTAPVTLIIFSLLTSPFIVFPIIDRSTKFAHQQLLTGISPLIYWSSCLIFDFILYLSGCLLFLLIFYISDWMTGYHMMLFILWILYFFASIFITYSASFIFGSPSKGQIVMFFYQLLIAMVALILSLYIAPKYIDQNTIWLPIVEGIINLLVPSYALGSGAAILTKAKMAHGIIDDSLWEWDQMGHIFTYLMVMAIVSCILFSLIQLKRVRKVFSCVWNSVGSGFKQVGDGETYDGNEDEGVIKERNNMSRANRDHLPLSINHLSKNFGKLKAVNDITFGVEPNKCFGLLGVNGAGKTTTFSIITGESFASSGNAYVFGVPVTNDSVRMGYCPQFDALLPELTGRQTLEILASLHGFKNPKRKAATVLKGVGMEEHADKETSKYSGGQRRKLSVGVAILAQNRLIVLDEPTAGIDPKARREIWDLLNYIREHGDAAILLTSHSMDECEALCSKIGILSKGSLVALGESQELKNRYGNSYTLTIVIEDKGMKNTVVEEVMKEFPGATLKPTESNTLLFKIDRTPQSHLSDLFKRSIDLSHRVRAKDFCLTQSSLEQTFMHIANEEKSELLDGYIDE